jgi:hypothetical protein
MLCDKPQQMVRHSRPADVPMFKLADGIVMSCGSPTGNDITVSDLEIIANMVPLRQLAPEMAWPI